MARDATDEKGLVGAPVGGFVGVCLTAAGLLVGSCSSGDPDSGPTTPIPVSANEAIVEQLDGQFDALMAREVGRRARSATIASVLQEPEEREEAVDLHHRAMLVDLYAERDYRAVWHGSEGGSSGVNTAGHALYGRLVEGVRSHGLWSDDLHVDRLRELFEPRGARTDRWKGSGLSDRQREAILTHLAEQGEDWSSGEDLERLTELVASPEGPTPEIARRVAERTADIEREMRRVAIRELLLSDGLADYLREMRYENPAWHQPRSHRKSFRVGDRGPLRAVSLAGEPYDKTPAELMGQAVRRARTRALTHEAMAEVFGEPETVREATEQVVPRFQQYQRLVEAFRRYRRIVDRGGWPEIPSSAEGLKAGQRSPHVRTLKQRLDIEGFWSPPAPEPAQEADEAESGDASGEASEKEEPTEQERYDEVFRADLREAVLTYQKTHQLWDHGSLTAQTLRSLNISARQRWNQLRVSLERWRESNIAADTHYVYVNIPDFHAEVWKEGSREMRFRVVTGQSTRKKLKDEETGEPTGEVTYPHATPTFSDTIEYVVLNPYWNVPHGIRKKELEPKLEENPDYYEEEGFEVVTDTNGYNFVRQKPGPDNALGKVKFLFPNEHSVYLHDTPHKGLFSQPTRAYSHGCVRIEKPMAFAHYLLDLDGRYTGERRKELLKKWFAKDSETWLSLRQTLPIHLDYIVARIDDAGYANFLADPYDRDEPRLAAVEERLSSFPNNYDMYEPSPDELLGSALAGELSEDDLY